MNIDEHWEQVKKCVGTRELGEKGLFVIFEIATKYIYLSCMRESVFSFVKRDEVL